MDVRIDDRVSRVEILDENKREMVVRVDERVYQLDVIEVASGIFSVLNNGISYNIEIVPADNYGEYIVNTLHHRYDVEVSDAFAKYHKQHKEGIEREFGGAISSPMPGKVVQIPVNIGDSIKVGQTLIVVSAMKMESEFKAVADGTVKDIKVNEGDTIEARQILIVIDEN